METSPVGSGIDRSIENIPARAGVLWPIVEEYRNAYPTGFESWSEDDVSDAGKKRFLLEGNRKPEKTIVGFRHYRLRRVGSKTWEAQTTTCSTKRTHQTTQCRSSFDCEVDARRQCESWRLLETSRLETEYPGSYEDIPEPGLGDLLQPRHRKALFAAQIELKRKSEPNFYEWCVRIHSATCSEAVDSLNDQLEIYKLLDKAHRGEQVPPILKCKSLPVELILRFKREIDHGKKSRITPTPDNLKIDKELVVGWIRRGYIFLPLWFLTRRLNLNMRTHITEAALEKRIDSLGLERVMHCGALQAAERDYLRLMDW
ncbi:MAG TPA: hypothetical protein VFE51_21115 [Verrucomicrobiae bacterium]|nr:hypothetical protein [Verrucomicrobiae bacterium]